jgi:hypothetical protein
VPPLGHVDYYEKRFHVFPPFAKRDMSDMFFDLLRVHHF